MNVKIDRSFERDTNKIKDNKLLEQIAACISDAGKSNCFKDIKNLKALLFTIV